MYEKAICDVADVLLKNNVLILTNGCDSFPLMKMGYCQTSELAYNRVGDNLKEFLGDDLPPVWHVGECIDNARSSGIFAGVAGAAEHKLYEMPYAFTSPEWSNEKGIDAALGFRLMGINSYHCVEAQTHASQKRYGISERFYKRNFRLCNVCRCRSGSSWRENGRRYKSKT